MGINWGERGQMKKALSTFFALLMLVPVMSFATTITLMNNSTYTLKAVVFAADGTNVGEFTLLPQEATEWSNEYENFGLEESNAQQEPYSVNWYCQSGSPYGTCSVVSAGAFVTAQSCEGVQECQKNPPQPQP